MNAISGKIVSVVAIAVAAVFAAYAWMRVSDDRTRLAEYEAQRAQAVADAEKHEADAAVAAENREREEVRKAEENRRKAETDRKKAEADRERAAEERAKAEAERETAEAEAQKAADERARAADERAKAEAERAAEEARKAAALAEAEKARIAAKSQEDSDAAKVHIAEMETERVRLVAARAEAEADVLRHRRMGLEDLARELAALKRDLDEREEALRPEKTILDLATTSADDSRDGGAERSGPVLPEDDVTTPRETRALAKSLRLESEMEAEIAAATRTNVVSRLERRYEEALRADDIVQADFYRQELKRLYPDWVYTPQKKEAKEEEKK